MGLAFTLLSTLMALTALGWIALFILHLVKLGRAPRVSAADASNFPSDAPLVSILVPARNEEHRILELAIASMARQDYPNVEVIAVDDRSTDRTLEILQRIAVQEPRVRVIRGEPLPEGWLGKPWALEQAKRAARGRWILATDADIIFAPEAARTAMSIAFRGRFDAVSFLPGIGGHGFWTRVVLPVASWLIASIFPIDKANDPKSRIALGCGALFLMRREAHDEVGGFEAIKSDVVDDIATARAFKWAGRRYRVELAQSLLHTPMYEDLGELWEGFSKNGFAGADNKLGVVILRCAANLTATALPMLLLLAGAALWLGAGQPAAQPLAIFAAAAYTAMVLAFVPVYAALDESPLLAPLAGIGNLIMVLILINSTYSHLSGRGVEWKGQRLSPGGPPGSGVASGERASV